MSGYPRFNAPHELAAAEAAGSARNPDEQANRPIYDVQGVRVGHLAYTFGLNGLVAPAPWAVNLIDPAQIRRDALAMRAAGAEIAVVSLHFGIEKDPVPSTYQEQVVDQVMAGPEVDLVIGHHAHSSSRPSACPTGGGCSSASATSWLRWR